MILVGLGSNVTGPWGSPRRTVEKAIRRLDEPPLTVRCVSALQVTAPVGLTDQPDFVNAVAIIETALGPDALLSYLHDVELEAERRRTVRWGPRTLDLDLLDYDGEIHRGEDAPYGHRGALMLPHPELARRAFVLEPIVEIAPQWRHPISRKSAQELLAELGGDEGRDASSG